MAVGWRSAAKSTRVKDILLLDQYREGRIAWHAAVFGDYAGGLQKLWSWAKADPIKRENLNRIFLD
jgi:hypothetical protein